MITRRSLLKGLALTAVSAPLQLPSIVFSQSGRVGRIVVGVPPGGSLDFVARLVAEQLREGTGRNVIVENKPGAALRIAIEAVVAAEADGSVLLLTPATMLTIYPYIYKNLKYDAFKDLAPVSNAVTFDFAFAVGPSTPAANIREFAAWAKANPKSAAFASPANGSAPHFLGVMLAKRLGIVLNHIPYKGAAPAVQDLLGGQVASGMLPIGDVAQHHRSGKLKVLATTGAKRAKLLPDVPTLRESGIDVEGKEWYGLLAPAGTPLPVRESLSAMVQKGMRRPEVAERVASIGFEPTPSTPAEFASLIKADFDAWGPIVKETGFTVDE